MHSCSRNLCLDLWPFQRKHPHGVVSSQPEQAWPPASSFHAVHDRPYRRLVLDLPRWTRSVAASSSAQFARYTMLGQVWIFPWRGTCVRTIRFPLRIREACCEQIVHHSSWLGLKLALLWRPGRLGSLLEYYHCLWIWAWSSFFGSPWTMDY